MEIQLNDLEAALLKQMVEQYNPLTSNVDILEAVAFLKAKLIRAYDMEDLV